MPTPEPAPMLDRPWEDVSDAAKERVRRPVNLRK